MTDDPRSAATPPPERGGGPQDAALEAAFAAARAEGAPDAPLPAHLAARLTADAAVARPARSAARWRWPRPGPLVAAGAAGRGWAAALGLAACAAAGLWLGYAPPPLLAEMSARLLPAAALSPADFLAPLAAEPLDV